MSEAHSSQRRRREIIRSEILRQPFPPCVMYPYAPPPAFMYPPAAFHPQFYGYPQQMSMNPQLGLRRAESLSSIHQLSASVKSVHETETGDITGEEVVPKSTQRQESYAAHKAREESFLAKLKFWEGSVKMQEDSNDKLMKDSYDWKDKYEGVSIEELDSASVLEDPKKRDDIKSSSSGVPAAAVVPVRLKHSTPLNTLVMFVPQQEAWIVERMGKFHRILDPGLNILIPLLDKVKYVQSLKEIAIDIPQQTAISMDNVTINIDGVLYLRILDAYKASYGVEDPEFAITQIAQTTMRSEIGKITLDTLFKERESLNHNIVAAINQASEAWGISCMRYEIRDIRMPTRVQEAMQMQVEAERKKRASILESEGIKAAEINIAEGKKQSRILSSEAEKTELINSAQGSASAVVAAGEARARSIELIAEALKQNHGQNAASLAVAEKYVSAFGELAKTNNTLILPANTGDVTHMVAQAMSIYKNLHSSQAIEVQSQDNDNKKLEN